MGGRGERKLLVLIVLGLCFESTLGSVSLATAVALTPQVAEPSSFLELAVQHNDHSEFVFLGSMAVLSVLFSTFCVFQLLSQIAFQRKVDKSQKDSLGMYLMSESDFYDDLVLKPSGFTENDKMQYQDFLSGEGVIEDEVKKRRFESRREYEEKVYLATLIKKMYVATFNGKKFGIEVALPTVLFMALQITSYMTAFELASQDA